MKNTLEDLNDYLFEQLERINDDELTEDELDVQIKRSKAMCEVSANIIQNAEVVLKGLKMSNEYGIETPIKLISNQCRKKEITTQKN